jgi:hypothetical protein
MIASPESRSKKWSASWSIETSIVSPSRMRVRASNRPTSVAVAGPQNAARFREPIATDLWYELQGEGLLREDAPVPL